MKPKEEEELKPPTCNLQAPLLVDVVIQIFVYDAVVKGLAVY